MKMLHLIKSLLGLICLTVLPAMRIAAQQLTPTVVGSAGATLQSASNTARLSFTTGEALIQTLVVTGEVSLGQGFHNAATDGIVKNREVLTDVDILLYPNPASEYLYAVFSTWNNSPVQLQACVFDATGREIVAGLSFSASGRYTIPVHSLTDGIYTLRFSNAQGQSSTFHFIKIK